MRWGMVIDFKRYIVCNDCVLACAAELLLLPRIFWNKDEDY